MVNTRVSVPPAASFRLTVKRQPPTGAAGVPLRVAAALPSAAGTSVKPAGKAPADTAQVKGALPPVPASATE